MCLSMGRPDFPDSVAGRPPYPHRTMPYIPQDARPDALTDPTCSGELNFAITALITSYIARTRLCYATINDIMGALEGAKAEFYRRVVAPYEDGKIEENGDVYPKNIEPIG